MKAYTNGITKEQFVNETIKHQQADAFLRGKYSKIEDGKFKGCAVGCAIKSIADLKGLTPANYESHVMYETHLGVPEWLARLEDSVFENITLERSKIWPLEFAQAINQGSDLDKIKVPFIVYLMRENIKSIDSCVYDVDKFADVKKAIDQTREALNQMIDAQESGDEQKMSAAESAARSARSAAESAESAAWSARSAAESAAWSAESAAWSAAWSAESAAWSARSAAESAESAAWSARSAAESAESAAWSARSAAESAAWSAESAAWSAESAAWSAAFEQHADKLLELIRECGADKIMGDEK